MKDVKHLKINNEEYHILPDKDDFKTLNGISVVGVGELPDVLPYEEQYFTIKALSATKIRIFVDRHLHDEVDFYRLSYSINGGAWVTHELDPDVYPGINIFVILYKGDTLRISASADAWFDSRNHDYFACITSVDDWNGEVDIYGNIMSLLWGDNFRWYTYIGRPYTFCSLFSNYNDNAVVLRVVDASNLILPPSVEEYSYEYCFYNCSSLKKAPYLSSLDTVDGCYSGMFYQCTCLNEVRCAALLSDNENNETDDWLHGVANSGTLILNDQASVLQNSVSGCPSGWTIKYDLVSKSKLDSAGGNIELIDLLYVNNNVSQPDPGGDVTP